MGKIQIEKIEEDDIWWFSVYYGLNHFLTNEGKVFEKIITKDGYVDDISKFREELCEEYETEIPTSTIRNILNVLVLKKFLAREKIGKKRVYYLNPESVNGAKEWIKNVMEQINQ